MNNTPKGINLLSPRQKQILRLIGKGHQAKEIARALGLSAGTIRSHLEVARTRLAVGSSREAARRLMDYEALCNLDGPLPLQMAEAREAPPLLMGTQTNQVFNSPLVSTVEGAPSNRPDTRGTATSSMRRDLIQLYVAFVGGLSALNVVQWLALISIGAVTIVFLFGGLLIGLFGLLQAAQLFIS